MLIKEAYMEEMGVGLIPILPRKLLPRSKGGKSHSHLALMTRTAMKCTSFLKNENYCKWMNWHVMCQFSLQNKNICVINSLCHVYMMWFYSYPYLNNDWLTGWLADWLTNKTNRLTQIKHFYTHQKILEERYFKTPK